MYLNIRGIRNTLNMISSIRTSRSKHAMTAKSPTAGTTKLAAPRLQQPGLDVLSSHSLGGMGQLVLLSPCCSRCSDER